MIVMNRNEVQKEKDLLLRDCRRRDRRKETLNEKCLANSTEVRQFSVAIELISLYLAGFIIEVCTAFHRTLRAQYWIICCGEESPIEQRLTVETN